MTVIIDQSGQIVNSLNNLVIFGSIGAVLAVAVLFLFLRSVRSIAVIASAIPLSVVVTLVLLYFADLNINLMTLGGLALGTGMLVDNAIIVLENIFRHRSLGKKATVAAVDGAKEVGSAVLAATLTTVAVFLPVTFLDSFVGQLFKELGLTVTLSLAASLVVALTVVPVMASRLLRAGAAVPAEVPESVVAPAVLAEAAAAQERQLADVDVRSAAAKSIEQERPRLGRSRHRFGSQCGTMASARHGIFAANAVAVHFRQY